MDNTLEHDIINVYAGLVTKKLTIEDCAELLEIKGTELNDFFAAFQQLIKEGTLMKCNREQYTLSEKAPTVTGIYKGYTNLFGFVIGTDLKEDVYISDRNRNTAMHNDKVEVCLMASGNRGHKQEGEITRIIERANTTIVGTYDRQKRVGFVKPDDERIPDDVVVPLDKTMDARSGARVVVTITKWPKGDQKAEGYISEILGYDGDKDLDINVIIARHKLPFHFSEEVMEECKKITTDVQFDNSRQDFRGDQTITIDGEDAKDLDDAVTVRSLSNGTYELGVHIADVSHYVHRGSAIDQEAFRRGTSVYLVDRVIPMLPKFLSNGICSLNAGEDRYAMSCVMEINASGTVVSKTITPSIIKVDRRCNYTEIRKALLEDIIPDDLVPFMPMLQNLRKIASYLRARRIRRGAIDFDFPEYKVLLDDNGKPLQLVKRERSISEQMIEESMLIANETVATYLQSTENPSVYRVHEVPNPEKIALLQRVIAGFELTLPLTDDVKPADLQKLLDHVKGTPAEPVVQMMTLRSMQQARYTPENLKHFGLASECYTHFTSPIRRYPDLLVHRLIRQAQHQGKLAKLEYEKSLTWLSQAALQASERERAAVEAERDTDDLKKAEYMVQFLGQTFESHITGLTPFGMFVGLENGIEGLIHISTMVDDLYYFEENAYTMIGTHSGQVYRLGDLVMVTLAKVDTDKYEIDFVLGDNVSPEKLQELMDKRSRRSGKREENKSKLSLFGKNSKNTKKKKGNFFKKRKTDKPTPPTNTGKKKKSHRR